MPTEPHIVPDPEKEKTDRTLLTTVVSIFLVAVVIGFGLSYFSSRNADQMAATSGSSTQGKAANTSADLANKKPAETTGSNVPPASAR